MDDYKHNKEIEKPDLPLMYVVKSTPKGVERFERQIIEINKGRLIKRSNNTEWKESFRYKFNEPPYEIELTDDETSSIIDGFGSGFGDLWEWSFYCTLSKEDADQYAKMELQRVTEYYLKPHKSVFLIEKGWIDPMENINTDGYMPFGYKFNEDEAKKFCESKGFWTENDCYSIAYKTDGKMAKYKYTEIPFCYED